jgi:hypothetical protein
MRIGFKKYGTAVAHLFLTSGKSIGKHRTFASLTQICSIKMADL